MKKKFIIIMLLIVLIFTGCTNKNNDEYKFKEEYESLNGTIREKDGKTIRSITIPKKNGIKYITPEELITKMEEGETFVVYFGFSDCPWCRSVLPTLIKVTQERELPYIYYISVSDIRDTLTVNDDGTVITTKEGSEGYYKLLEKLDSVLNDYSLKDKNGNKVDSKEKRIYAPNIVSVIKGVPTNMVEGISQNQTDGYMELTEEMIKETYDVFDNFLDPVITDLSTCELDKEC